MVSWIIVNLLIFKLTSLLISLCSCRVEPVDTGFHDRMPWWGMSSTFFTVTHGVLVIWITRHRHRHHSTRLCFYFIPVFFPPIVGLHALLTYSTLVISIVGLLILICSPEFSCRRGSPLFRLRFLIISSLFCFVKGSDQLFQINQNVSPTRFCRFSPIPVPVDSCERTE